MRSDPSPQRRGLLLEDRPATDRDEAVQPSELEEKAPLAWRLRLILGASLALWTIIILVAWWILWLLG